MKIFVKASQFDLTLKRGRSPEPKVREVKFVTRSSNFLDLEINERSPRIWQGHKDMGSSPCKEREHATSGNSVSEYILHGYG